MGLYNSKQDFDKLTLDFPWLNENLWIKYYNDIVDEKDPFENVKNYDYNFKFRSGTKVKSVHECLAQLYEYQSLDKFLEPDYNPHLKRDEKQLEQEIQLLSFVFPNKTLSSTRVMPDEADLRNYPSMFKHTVSNRVLFVHRNCGIIFENKPEKSEPLHGCATCDTMDHTNKQCTEKCPCGQYHKPTDHKCFMCNEIGFDHVQKDCEMTCPCRYYHRKDQHKCYVCKLKGYDHEDKECPARCRCKGNFSDYHLPEEHVCYGCDKVGYEHDYADCPVRIKEREERKEREKEK